MIEAANLCRDTRQSTFDPCFDIDLNLRELLTIHGAQGCATVALVAPQSERIA
jgi:hypothetical protein